MYAERQTAIRATIALTNPARTAIVDGLSYLIQFLSPVLEEDVVDWMNNLLNWCGDWMVGEILRRTCEGGDRSVNR